MEITNYAFLSLPSVSDETKHRSRQTSNENCNSTMTLKVIVAMGLSDFESFSVKRWPKAESFRLAKLTRGVK